MLFTCDPTTKKVDIVMLYNAAGEYKDSVLKWTTIDGKEITLDRSEIKETVRASGAMYVSALVHISDRLESALSSAHVVRFMMVPPSQSIYAGWDSDLASGRDKYIEYAKTCR
jgi:hypothetical protein